MPLAKRAVIQIRARQKWWSLFCHSLLDIYLIRQAVSMGNSILMLPDTITVAHGNILHRSAILDDEMVTSIKKICRKSTEESGSSLVGINLKHSQSQSHQDMSPWKRARCS